jgi:hypothetical protein
MANVIRHKRGTSNPAAGNFSQTAELLVNTSDGGVFTKTDGGSVVEVGSNASNLSTGTVPSGRLSGSYGISVTGSSASCTGNAASATVLQTARTIGGVSFNGSANINLPGVNTAGNQNTSGNAASATVLQTARTIGGVSFNGSANINLPGVNTTGNQNTSGSSASCTGNAATATTLQTARTINGVSFNGSANITVESYVENDDSTNATRYLTFVDNTTAAFKRLNEDSSLTYNPSSNVLSAGTFSGSGASLSSLNASNLSSGTVPSARLSGTYAINVTGTISGSSDYAGLLRSNANDTATGILTFNAACRGQVDALSSASTITPNFNNSNNFSISLSTNTTIANPSNLTAGQSGAIAITYNGAYTVAFGSYWKFAGGTAPTATSTSGKVDVLVYYVESSTRISAQLLLNMGG